jgi:hypothetical protein
MMQINENNYRIVKAQILAIKEVLQDEIKRNHKTIIELEKRQNDIKAQWQNLIVKMEIIGEFELESEYRFLIEIERKCERCGKVFDKRHGNDKLCPACFTSNA